MTKTIAILALVAFALSVAAPVEAKAKKAHAVKIKNWPSKPPKGAK
jgi:hypothetical protein